MSGLLLGLLAVLLSPQERGMKELVELLGAPDAPIRDRASTEILGQWKRWSLADLDLLSDARPEDPEVAARAREALARIRIRRCLGDSLLGAVSGLEAACLSRNEERLLQALDRAEQLSEKNGIDGADMVTLLRWISEQKWTERVDEKVRALAKKGFVADPSLVLPLLTEEDPTRRQSALETLARLRARPLAGRIVPLLSDAHPDVRQHASTTLRTLRARDQTPAILPLLEKGAESRLRALNLLGEIGSREAAPRILPHLKDPLFSIRQAAIRSLAKMRAREFSGELVPLLGDPIPAIRRDAAEALGTLEAFSEIPKLEALLGSADVATRAGAAAALGELSWGGEALLPLLKDPDLEVRQKAVTAIGRGGNRRFASNVKPLLSDAETWVQGSALEALGRIGEPLDTKAILPFLEHRDALLREKAIDALGRIGEQEHCKAVVAGLKDAEGRVRAASLRALGRLRGSDLLLLAQPFLGDSDPVVREQAISALATLGDPAVVGIIRAGLQDSDGRVRVQAARLLCAQGAAEDVGDLLQLLDDPIPWVRARAASVLGQLGSRVTRGAARERLVLLLRTTEREPEWEVEVGAGVGLLVLGAKDRKAQRDLVQQFQTPGLGSETTLTQDLLDGLNQIHEQAGFARFIASQTNEFPVDSPDAFRRLVQATDFDLTLRGPLRIWGRGAQGARQSLRDLVRLSTVPRAVELSGTSLILGTWHEALEHWLERLRD